MNEVTNPLILDETGRAIADAINNVATAIDGEKQGIIYGFHIDNAESDPSAKVTYLKDAAGMTPAHMNFTSGEFDYGSWEDAFFMPRPCMLKSDGTVDYYLKASDYTKKEDGTASDIANTAYAGNAMMEWGRNGKKIWMKIVPSADGKSGDVFIADHKADAGFHDWPFHNCNGESVPHFYTAIYNGSLVSSTLRSLSGQALMKKKTGTEEITAATANNTGASELWNIECIADRMLINMLLILMGKSTNTQAVFGEGAHTGGSEAVNDTFTTGIHNTKGLFFGTNSGSVSANNFENCVKVFGMENYWGLQWRRQRGYINANGVQKVKLTYGQEDGSTVSGYNTDGSGYIPLGITPTGTSGGYIDEMKFTEQGMFGKNSSGDATHDYCDGQWFNNGIVAFALCGGYSSAGAPVGAFCCSLYSAVSNAYWSRGAAASCKPLA